jgi:hypothetical protein
MLDAEDRLVCVDVATGELVTALADVAKRRSPGAPGSDINLSPDGTKLYAAFALSGSTSSWEILERFKVKVPDDFEFLIQVFRLIG